MYVTCFLQYILYYYYCYYFSRPSLTACSTVFAIERKYIRVQQKRYGNNVEETALQTLTHIYTQSHRVSSTAMEIFLFFSYFVGRSPVMSFIMQKHKPRIFFFSKTRKRKEKIPDGHICWIFFPFLNKKGEKGTWEDTSERQISMVFLLCQQRQSTVYRKPFLGFYKKTTSSCLQKEQKYRKNGVDGQKLQQHPFFIVFQQL